MARKASLSVDVILFIDSAGVGDMLNSITLDTFCCSPQHMLLPCSFIVSLLLCGRLLVAWRVFGVLCSVRFGAIG